MTIPDSLEFNFMDNGSIELPCKPQEEKRIVDELTAKADANLREGNLFYVVSNRWFMTWKRYTEQVEDADSFDDNSTTHELVKSSETVDRPGPIDNTDIIAEGENKDDDTQLNKSLIEGNDYLLVPEEVWEKLVNWYKGGPALPRKMITVGDQYNKQFRVEVFPLCLRIVDSRNQSDVMIKISKKASVYDLCEKVCGLTGLRQGQVRIWDFFDKEKHNILVSSNESLEDANIQMDQDILLEVLTDTVDVDSTGNGLALIPVEPTRSQLSIAGGPSTSNGTAAGYSSETYQRSNFTFTYGDIENGPNDLKPVSRGVKGGLAGLQNLGNTCFMNSALQCLVHTPHLAEYFLEDFTDEINKENPLGMRGELALAFGDLLRKLWSSGRGPVAPRVFKGKLGRFAPQFSGYNQHDSQELLAFLLDGLHEDLNRVKQKPYIETKDIDGRPDEEVANEFWRYHKARNDSVIVDICQGQYKSTLVCPSCEKISITFDPFMYLSLPLPSTSTRLMTVTVFYGDGSHLPMPFTVKVLNQGCFKDLIEALSTECCIQTDEYLLLAEVYNHRIYRYFDNLSEQLMTVKDDEYIVAYRLPKTKPDSTKLEINHRYMDFEKKAFLTPLVTILEDAESGEHIDIAVGKVLSCLKKKAFHLSSNPNGENGTSEAEMNDIMESESASGSSNDIEMEGISNEKLSFNLCITDDRGYGAKPLMKDTPISPRRIVKVFVDWTKKEHELYDASYLKDLPVVLKTGIFSKKVKQEAISLFSCLDAYLKEEPLGPDDMWYCPKCKEHRQATKKLDLWKLPDVLVFHLKRFSYSRWMKNKLDSFVNFPINNLDLSKYVRSKDASGGSNVYELFAISNHYGGLGGGHYSAYCKLIDENKWYHFDDSHVSQVNESEIRTSAAYVLFYKRVKSDSNGTTTTDDGESLKADMDE